MSTATVKGPLRYDGPPPASAAGLIGSDDAFAATLTVLAYDAFGDKFLHWHPGTLENEMQRAYGVALPERSADRLKAGLFLLTTEFFWESAHRFEIIAPVLNGLPFAPNVVSPPDVRESAWAVTEARLIEPPGVPIAPELLAYLGERCRFEGFVSPPKAFTALGVPDPRKQFAQDWADVEQLGSGLLKAADAKAGLVDLLVAESLHELLDQLAGLPLRRADAKQAVDRIRKAAK